MKSIQLARTGFVIMFFVIANQAHALTASPVKVEVTGDPGQTLQGELELLNEQGEQKVLFSSFENFEPQGDTGSPRFIGAKDGLATWLHTENSVTILPGEKVIIPYTISIPADTEPGGYFSAIFFGAQNPKSQEAGEVSIGGKLGILILLRVSGDIEDKAGISEFVADGGKKLFSSLPITFSYRFSNKGGDRVVPLGAIEIKNMFGGKSASLPANVNEGNVLPDSSRKFKAVWGIETKDANGKSFFVQAKNQLRDFHLGLYSAHISVAYGATNQTASDVYRFVIIPWQLLTLCLVGLFVALFGLRKYNSWIISRSATRN